MYMKEKTLSYQGLKCTIISILLHFNITIITFYTISTMLYSNNLYISKDFYKDRISVVFYNILFFPFDFGFIWPPRILLLTCFLLFSFLVVLFLVIMYLII